MATRLHNDFRILSLAHGLLCGPDMSGRVVFALSAAAVFSWTLAGRAEAYDPHFTHRWLTRQSLERLVAAHPGVYDEVLAYADEIAAGAEEEDHEILDGDTDPTTLRVMRHFFRPTDGAGLTMGGRTFPNSHDWGVLPSETNVWDWSDGLEHWRRGRKAEAYRVLGHLLHLLQDATVPAHTHLDVHGPPAGDDYEEWCSARMVDEHTSTLPRPPADRPLPEFRTPYEAWRATARASYRRNLYPGDLRDREAPSGIVAAMFPSISWHWFHQEWRIDDPAIGALGQGFFEHEPGLYYFKRVEFPAAVDQTADGAGYEPNTAALPMAALMARDLVPIAIDHGAALAKLYLDEMYAQPPTAGVDPRDPATGDGGAGGDEGVGGCRIVGGRTEAALAQALVALAALCAVCRRRN